MVKRLFDVLLAFMALLLLAPLFAFIAVAIKRDSRGPVFFRQERVGRHGMPFCIHKFRTMKDEKQRTGDARGVSEEEQMSQITVGADPRITRFGSFLRRTKLDELPQLIDVLAGTMSLVGPRPEVPRYVALYPPDLRAKVLSVRPGITDLASIEYHDENTLLARAADPEREYREVVMPAKLQIAARYVDQMSFMTDVRVIGATLRLLWARPS